MPSSTLDRPRTRAKPSDWVVVVPGQQPDDAPASAALAAPAGAGALIRPGVMTGIPSFRRPPSLPAPVTTAIGRFVLMAGLVGAFMAVIGLVSGRNPLLLFGIVSPTFTAYQAETAEGVRYVLDDGMSTTAAVPGALLMDWSQDRATPALRLTMGNPAAEPEVSKLTADGKSIEEIRYRSAWPGIDAEIRAQPGGFSGNFIVQPGVDPAVIELEYVGASELTVDAAGRLHVKAVDGVWIDGTPESWQDGPAGREPVESKYELRGGGKFGFVVGPYDPSRSLTVDPPSEKSN